MLFEKMTNNPLEYIIRKNLEKFLKGSRKENG